MRRAAVAALALLAAGCGGGGGAGTSASVAVRPLRTVDGCIPLGPSSHAVTLHVQRGLTAAAAIVGTGSRGVVLANQSDRNLCAWRPLARELAHAGFRVLVFDYSGADPQADVAAAVRRLRTGGATSVGLLGASKGARAVLVAGSLRGVDPSAVVSLSAENGGRTGPPRIEPFVHRLRAPLLLVSARQDPWTANAADTREQYAVAGSPHKRMLLRPGDAHGVDLLAGPAGLKLTATIIRFLQGS
jgi:hypothetical protein